MPKSHTDTKAPRVLAALLEGTPEHALLDALRLAGIRLQEHHHRATFLARLRTYRPSVILLPVSDARNRPSAPLIGQAHIVSPTTRVIALSTSSGSSRHLLMALREEAAVLVAPSGLDVLAAVQVHTSITYSPGPSSEGIFGSVEPEFLRRVLCAGWNLAEARSGVVAIAARLGLSARTLAREARRHNVSTPRQIMAAVRFLRAYAAAGASLEDRGSGLGERDGGLEVAVALASLPKAVAYQIRSLGGRVGQDVGTGSDPER